MCSVMQATQEARFSPRGVCAGGSGCKSRALSPQIFTSIKKMVISLPSVCTWVLFLKPFRLSRENRYYLVVPRFSNGIRSGRPASCETFETPRSAAGSWASGPCPQRKPRGVFDFRGVLEKPKLDFRVYGTRNVRPWRLVESEAPLCCLLKIPTENTLLLHLKCK